MKKYTIFTLSFRFIIPSTYNHYSLLSNEYLYTHLSQMNEYSIFTTTKL